jgi:hypothetical protein
MVAVKKGLIPEDLILNVDSIIYELRKAAHYVNELVDALTELHPIDTKQFIKQLKKDIKKPAKKKKE